MWKLTLSQSWIETLLATTESKLKRELTGTTQKSAVHFAGNALVIFEVIVDGKTVLVEA